MTKLGRKPIQDKFTDLKVSRQRKWQLRHPRRAMVAKRELERVWFGYKRRNRNAKSYRMEREIGIKEYDLNARSYKEEKEQKRIWSI